MRQLGIGNTTNQSSPVQVGTAANWASVSTSQNGHTLAIKTDGTLWAWGRNTSGQLAMELLPTQSALHKLALPPTGQVLQQDKTTPCPQNRRHTLGVGR
jgi:alpha-tubulin suppressor-like RCC1 family protein